MRAGGDGEGESTLKIKLTNDSSNLCYYSSYRLFYYQNFNKRPQTVALPSFPSAFPDNRLRLCVGQKLGYVIINSIQRNPYEFFAFNFI